jgi:hypothetical protein
MPDDLAKVGDSNVGRQQFIQDALPEQLRGDGDDLVRRDIGVGGDRVEQLHDLERDRGRQLGGKTERLPSIAELHRLLSLLSKECIEVLEASHWLDLRHRT